MAIGQCINVLYINVLNYNIRYLRYNDQESKRLENTKLQIGKWCSDLGSLIPK